MKALNPLACYAFGNVYFSTLFTRKVIYGFSFFLHGKKILKIQLMIRLHILWSSWSSPSCKKSLLLSLCKKFVIFVSYCHPGHRYFAKSYFRRLLVMITYSCFLQWYPQQDIHGWYHQYVFCCTSLYSRTLCRWEKKKIFLFTDMILQQRRKFLLKTLDLSLDFPHLGPIPPNQIYLIFWPECPFKLTFGGGGSSSLSSTSSSS